MGWKKVTLGDVAEIKKGKKAEEVKEKTKDSVRYIQIEDLRNDFNVKYCMPNNKTVIVNKRDIIIAWDGANAGTINYGLNGAIGSTLAFIRLKKAEEDFYVPYIGRFLQTQERYLKDNCKGATIPHVRKEVLQGIKIPLPPMEIQKKIADALDKAQNLIDKRKEQLEKLDDFVQSVFLDMFGDPVVNPKGWEELKLSKIGELSRGRSRHRPRNDPKLLGGKYPLIQTGDVSNAGLYIKEYNQTYSELGLQQSKMWDAGTLCITIAANIAETGILAFDACFPDSIVGFTPNEKANSIYVQFWFMFLQKIIEANAPESAQKNINLRILRNLDIPVPPLKLQNKFAKIVEETEKKREIMERSLTKMETNFKSIMQKAFKGELF